jgi:hypothetical protein
MLKMAVQRGRSERRGEAYPQGYVEPLSDARTKLADFFSILLTFCVASRTLCNHVQAQRKPL